MNESLERSDKVRNLSTRIKEQVETARLATRADDEKTIAKLCFEIGRTLAGETLDDAELASLATQLEGVASERVSLSQENLSGMKRFFAAYSDHVVLATLVDAISWPKHLEILTWCDNDRAQEFYIRMSRKFDWSLETLVQKIEDFRPPQ